MIETPLYDSLLNEHVRDQSNRMRLTIMWRFTESKRQSREQIEAAQAQRRLQRYPAISAIQGRP